MPKAALYFVTNRIPIDYVLTIRRVKLLVLIANAPRDHFLAHAALTQLHSLNDPWYTNTVREACKYDPKLQISREQDQHGTFVELTGSRFFQNARGPWVETKKRVDQEIVNFRIAVENDFFKRNYRKARRQGKEIGSKLRITQLCSKWGALHPEAVLRFVHHRA